jgi:hypothetical protein
VTQVARLLIACIAVPAVGCGSPLPAPPASIEVPAGWRTVANARGTLELTVPPWLTDVHDLSAGLLVESAPRAPGAETAWRLLLLEPDTEGTRIPPGQSVEAWFRARLGEEPGMGVLRLTEVSLPAGAAMRGDNAQAGGDPAAWRVVALALPRPTGVAYLQLYGPAGAWSERAEDIERVLLLVRLHGV